MQEQNFHARQLAPHLDALQLGEMDYDFIDRLQPVHRNMKAKQQALPIQFRLFGISKSEPDPFEALISRLTVDPEFARTLVLINDLGRKGRFGASAGGVSNQRLIALRETGVRIAVTGVYRPSAISALLSSKAVAAIRMPMKEALR